MSVRLFTPHPRTSPKRTLPRRFTTLYRTHYDFVWRCALRLGVDAADVDDVVQDTFLIALRRLDEFTDEGAAQPSTWLFAILRNVLRNHARGQRRRNRKQQAYGELQAERSIDAGEAERLLGIGLLDQFLGSLDPERRSVFVLAELEGHDSRAVGEALGINPNTARTRLRAARKQFAAAFEHDRLEQAVEATRVDPPKASEAARERVLAGIVIAAPLELVATSVGAGLGWVGKLTIAGLASLAAIATVVVVEASEPTPAPVVPLQAPARAPESTPASSVGEPEPMIVVAKVEPPKPAKTQRSEKPKPESSPALEAMRILADARTALIDGRAEDVLRLIQTQTWPDAALTARAQALEIGALCALDRVDEAKAIAEAHADHWLLDRDAKCW